MLINGRELEIKAYANLRDANLRGADLRNADLRFADLRANLRGANLSGADLSGANLSFADLSGANLRDVNLRGAKFVGADLSGADLRGANLTGADLKGAYLINVSGLVVLPCSDPRNYTLLAIKYPRKGWRFFSGCRGPLTYKEATKHWGRGHHSQEIAGRYRVGLRWFKKNYLD